MEKYVFDRKNFKWGDEFYDLIQKEMKLPEWFGKNADALWDMLTGFINTPCEIVLKNFTGKENDYNDEIITKILNCFFDAEKKFPNEFKVTIQQALFTSNSEVNWLILNTTNQI